MCPAYAFAGSDFTRMIFTASADTLFAFTRPFRISPRWVWLLRGVRHPFGVLLPLGLVGFSLREVLARAEDILCPSVFTGWTISMAILPILTAIAIDYKSDPRLFLPASFHPVCATIYIGLSIHQVDALAFRLVCHNLHRRSDELTPSSTVAIPYATCFRWSFRPKAFIGLCEGVLRDG